MPPFSITVTGETPNELRENLRRAVAMTDGATQAEPIAESPAQPRRSRAKPEAAPAPAAAPAAAPAPAAPVATDVEALKKQAIATLVKLINANDALGRNGKQVCTDLCLKFGGANISKIAADKYPDVIAEVEKELEALNSDPTA